MNYKQVQEMLYDYKYLNVKLKNINLDINSNIDVGIDIEYLYNLKSNIENKLNRINNVIDVLEPKEKELIDYIFFNKGKVKDFAIKNNVSEPAISMRKRKIINKLTSLITQ